MTGIFIRINSTAAIPNASRLLGTTAISKALITSAGFLCKPVKVPYFHLCGEQVWGATAMILSEFLEIIRKLKEGDLQ